MYNQNQSASADHRPRAARLGDEALVRGGQGSTALVSMAEDSVLGKRAAEGGQGVAMLHSEPAKRPTGEQ